MTQIEIVSADGFVAFSFGREVVASWENFQHILNCTSSGMIKQIFQYEDFSGLSLSACMSAHQLYFCLASSFSLSHIQAISFLLSAFIVFSQSLTPSLLLSFGVG